ncbi:hypothetical protein [Catenuloplanes atrovinosus]|uniref:ATP synthase protein I n=1 Tax=Catenuloplanes atrovinosus TaxID=137266 RepID=A0AAE4CFJ9_9ACTN|nr:hypothetical protein [Catenuloplanes atrovinosus]MDR7281069.1 hypothetical protein [Catenuloplanes atrovinosus]
MGHIVWPLAATAVLTVVLAVAGLAVDGRAGLLGALLGVALMAGGYLLSNLAVAWADSVMPKLVLTVGLATYIFKITLLGTVLLVVVDRDWAGVRMTAVGMVCALVIWISAQVWSSMRAPVVPPPVVSD